MKIVVAIDKSDFSAEVLRAVVDQFQPGNTRVRLIHVLQPITPAAPPQMDPRYAPELEYETQQARELVERYADGLRKAGFDVEPCVEIGDIRERIIDSAADWAADLIIIGSHGHRHMMRFLLGSVAEFVARHAKCSVQIVRRAVAP